MQNARTNNHGEGQISPTQHKCRRNRIHFVLLINLPPGASWSEVYPLLSSHLHTRPAIDCNDLLPQEFSNIDPSGVYPQAPRRCSNQKLNSLWKHSIQCLLANTPWPPSAHLYRLTAREADLTKESDWSGPCWTGRPRPSTSADGRPRQAGTPNE